MGQGDRRRTCPAMVMADKAVPNTPSLNAKRICPKFGRASDSVKPQEATQLFHYPRPKIFTGNS
jgi:hypothetical protein